MSDEKYRVDIAKKDGKELRKQQKCFGCKDSICNPWNESNLWDESCYDGSDDLGIISVTASHRYDTEKYRAPYDYM